MREKRRSIAALQKLGQPCLDTGMAIRHVNNWSDHFQVERLMNADDRKPAIDEAASAEHHAPWCEKAFKIQMLLVEWEWK
jgi:hypothetical protein